MRKLFALILVSGLSLSGSVYANTSPKSNSVKSSQDQKHQPKSELQNPVEVLKESVLPIQQLVVKNEKEYTKNHQALISMIQVHLIPYMDMDAISQDILGQKWTKATPTEQKDFVTAFMKMMVMLYSKNIAQVGDYSMSIYPLRTDSWKTAKNIQVQGNLQKAGSKSRGSDVTIYLKRFHQSWKIYDVAVEGVSIMQNYRSQFKSISTMKDAINAVNKVNARTEGK